MAKLSTYALAGALAFALAPVAGRAADLPEPPLLEPAAPVEFGSAWYIRGDVGYKSYRNPKASYRDSVYQAEGIANFKGEKLGDAAVIGGGVGYKFNDHFRSDLTLDYETKAKFKGDIACIDVVGCGGRDSKNKGKIDAWTVFLNGYFDLVTIGGFTPYVGGGVGFARVGLNDYDYIDPRKNPKKDVYGSYAGDKDWNFAWNLQAGASYQLTDNLLLDANYRFVDLGDVKTKSIKKSPSGDAKVKIDDLQAHEVRVGFRYMLD